ncbi:peptidase M3 [Gluconobacter thailandicus]|uniref:M3 family oligoendopeptidase n=1 Tax=Gluconobacter thailandicus TaxID=257438 RepID=UPI000777B29C|nr:M3 family oligoendopeptidase [Gluconobacter thailandicus]KXV35518.1 peptidase M3 [Gluconobacter thailandicus]
MIRSRVSPEFPPFEHFSPERPDDLSLQAAFQTLHDLLSKKDYEGAIRGYDRLRRSYESWGALTNLRFAQDTKSPERQAEKAQLDRVAQSAARHDMAFRQALLEEPHRSAAEEVLGRHILALWACEAGTFSAQIIPELQEEARLCNEYTALLAGAEISLFGQSVTLSTIPAYLESSDRAVRHEAEQARWSFFEENGERLDLLFDRLVKLRTTMARKLGFNSYAELAYRRLRRTGYGPEQAGLFREHIRKHINPLVTRILQQRQRAMGWESVWAWDEALVDPQGNPLPPQDRQALGEQAQAMFDRLDPSGEFGTFYKALKSGGYMDLDSRAGKAAGGFCTVFADTGAPFIFANFNGTHNDLGIFTHEMGHAYQSWKASELAWIDQIWPTMDAAEIPSMALEFLTWPYIGDLLADPAEVDRYRRMHLINAVSFFPYGACIDHFEYDVYENPDMTSAGRRARWRDLEKSYMPWRQWGDLSHPAAGGRWHAQAHVFRMPFYYLNYGLAQCSALQLWGCSRRDQAAAFETYRHLCASGGSKPMVDLLEEANLASPFEETVLQVVAQDVSEYLSISTPSGASLP